MTDYQLGQRVALTHTRDPNNPPHVSQQGTVLAYDAAARTIAVRWDDGTVTDVRLAAGDALDLLAHTVPISEDVWQRVLATVTARGADDGNRAVDAWSREHTDHDSQQLRSTARQILQALHDDEELEQTQAPQYDTTSFAQPPTRQQLSQLLAGAPTVPVTWWRQADGKYRDAFETAVRNGAGDWACRTLLPQAGGRDLAELRADQARIGRAGVFSGEWMWTYPDTGPDYLRMGFAGTLIDWWNGWAVFSCTRPVAEAIVAEQQQRRAHEREVLQADGMTPQDARREVDTMLADLYFDGDVIVTDQRVMADDPEAIERSGPDVDGRYVVMGWNWCWEVVNPYDCDHLVGELPAAGREQEFVLLTHTSGMRMPHEQVRLQVDKHWPVVGRLAYAGALWMDGQRVAAAGNDAAGGDADLVITEPSAAEPLRAFLAGCRYQGEPVGWTRVLDALADESYLSAAVQQATADGGTLVREVDDAGYTRVVRSVETQPSGWDGLTRLAAGLPRPDRGRWEIWTGRSWFALPTSTHRSS